MSVSYICDLVMGKTSFVFWPLDPQYYRYFNYNIEVLKNKVIGVCFGLSILIIIFLKKKKKTFMSVSHVTKKIVTEQFKKRNKQTKQKTKKNKK